MSVKEKIGPLRVFNLSSITSSSFQHIKIMKKLLPTLLAGCCLFSVSHATILVLENFDYDPGVVAGLNGGQGWSGAWGTGGGVAPVVAAGSLTAPSGYTFTPSGNRVENAGNGFISRGFGTETRPNLGSDGVYYMSWLIQTSVIGDVSRLNLVDNAFANRISIGKLGNANDNLAIQLSGGSVLYSETSLTGGDFLIVAKLESDNGTLTVSASAFPSTGSVGAEPTVWDISTVTTSADHVKNMLSMNVLMQGASGNISFDEFRLGTTYAAVIPEPTTYAALFGLLALGFVAWRRRKAA